MPAMGIPQFSNHPDRPIEHFMKPTAKNRLGKLLPGGKLGLMSRLSHLIIVQVVFVFAALAVIIFSPHDDTSISTGQGRHYTEFEAFADSVMAVTDANIEDLSESQSAVFGKLDELYRRHVPVRAVGLYVCAGDGFERVQAYHRDDDSKPLPWNEATLSILGHKSVPIDASGPATAIIPLELTDHYVVYCHPMPLGGGREGMLIAALDHDLVLWDRGAFGYALFLLFLCAALIALLTVYLIHRNFSMPFKRMVHGFEKTSDGELYYLMETASENELNQLATVFNKFSRTLYNDQKQLAAYDDRLRTASLSLNESRQLLTAVIGSSPVGIITADTDGLIVLYNRKAGEMFGYDDADVIGRSFGDLFTNSREACGAIESCNRERRSEVLAKRADGSQFPAYLISSSLATDAGATNGCVYIIRDISESKQFQEMMVRLDRYYTKGEMASEIAHEINNYLSILMGNVELVPLLLRKGKQDKLEAKLELMHTTIEKIARFTDGLLDGSHDQVHFASIDINQIVQNVLAFLEPQNRFDNIEVETDLSTDAPLVEVDPGLIQQVLVNLIYNAADAVNELEDGRKITVRTYLVDGAPEPTLGVTIHDNGPGVQSDKEPLLFRKRFTTKRNGHGIGLITCRKILDSHDGDITYEMADGARFNFVVPVNHAVEETDTPVPPTAETSPA